MATLITLATPAGAQTLRGVVFDSLFARPLGAATIQLVTDDTAALVVASTTTDSAGTYTLRGMGPGAYRIGFLHPLLDSLGLEPPVQRVVVTDTSTRELLLATPSPARLARVICGATPRVGTAADSGTVLFGIVRRDTYAVAAGASVLVQWAEVVLGARGLERRVAQRVARAAANGWFAVCDVPRGGRVVLQGRIDSVHHASIEVTLGEAPIARRDLFLASGVPQRLRGVVRRSDDGTPVAQALVQLGTQSVRTDARGGWLLPAAPDGSRMLDVRAIGYLPQRVAVDVHALASEAPVVLAPLAPLLETVRVEASAVAREQFEGFESRRAQGIGRFVTSDDIARWRPLTLSELYRRLPGTRVEFDPGEGRTRLLMRSLRGGGCAPIVVLNGLILGPLWGEELDALARPDEVAGLELYTENDVPAPFAWNVSGDGCGSLVVWLPLRWRR